CEQRGDLLVVHSYHERRHNLAAVLNPDLDVVRAWTTLRQGQPGVLEYAVEAGADLSSGFLIFVDVMAHGAVLAVKALAQTSGRLFPWRGRLWSCQKHDGRNKDQPQTHARSSDFSTLNAPAWYRQSVAGAASFAWHITRR